MKLWSWAQTEWIRPSKRFCLGHKALKDRPTQTLGSDLRGVFIPRNIHKPSSDSRNYGISLLCLHPRKLSHQEICLRDKFPCSAVHWCCTVRKGFFNSTSSYQSFNYTKLLKLWRQFPASVKLQRRFPCWNWTLESCSSNGHIRYESCIPKRSRFISKLKASSPLGLALENMV